MFGKKFFTSLILLLFFSGCGYSPVYKNLNNKNLKIEVSKLTGDNLVNSNIKSRLKIYSKSNSNFIYQVDINTNYEKEDLSKDLTGRITNYTLKFITEFTINSSKINKKIIIEENFNLNNSDDAYKNNQSENLIKRNFANIAVERLISELLLMK